jgi:hypothetical protein
METAKNLNKIRKDSAGLFIGELRYYFLNHLKTFSKLNLIFQGLSIGLVLILLMCSAYPIAMIAVGN